jgi:hypothetical protein
VPAIIDHDNYDGGAALLGFRLGRGRDLLRDFERQDFFGRQLCPG